MFSIFFEKEMSKVGLLDLGKSQNEQSHEVSWIWLKNCRHGEQILCSMGHNSPCPCGIGLTNNTPFGSSNKDLLKSVQKLCVASSWVIGVCFEKNQIFRNSFHFRSFLKEFLFWKHYMMAMPTLYSQEQNSTYSY